MKNVKIGSFEVPVVALGTWAIGGGPAWGDNDDRESIDTIRKAVDMGVELIDTAPVYGFGHSEEVVGKALKGIRDKVRISTKCGLVWEREGAVQFEEDGLTIRRNLKADTIVWELEQSLRRLQTDHIDVYITHWQSLPEFPVPVEETMGALLKLKEQGKILAIGCSNMTPELLDEYLKVGKVDLIQEKFSILTQDNWSRFGRQCSEHGIVFQPYSPLEMGILTGKITADYVPAAGTARTMQPWFQKENLKVAVDMVESWKPLTEKYDATPTQLAIAWTAALADNISVLCGARKESQLMDNVKGGDVNLSKEDFDFMAAQAEKAIAAKL